MEPLPVESCHTILYCRKWDACVEFYRDVLGFKVVDARPGFVEFEVTPESRIGLIRAVESGDTESGGDSTVLTFRVKNLDEIHRMLSARVEGLSAVRRHPWGARLFELRDPEGRRLEFWIPD